MITLLFTVSSLFSICIFIVERPLSITVDIYKNGDLHESVQLESDNNWSYSWKVDDPNSRWTVVEREVPEDYLVTITLADNVFTITNAYSVSSDEIPDDPPIDTPDDPPADTPEGEQPVYPNNHPETGDTTYVWKYVIVMAFSGIVLLLVGSLRKRC